MLQKEISTKIGLIILGVIFVFCAAVLFYTGFRGDLKLSSAIEGLTRRPGTTGLQTEKGDIKKFVSEDDFKKYLADHQGDENYYGGMAVRSFAAEGGGIAMQDLGLEMAVPTGLGGGEKAALAPSAAPSPDRFSETNVQVVGIDEPDIVKTDGKEIYYSIAGGYYPWRGVPEPMPMIEERAVSVSVPPSYRNEGEVKLIAAFPPDQMKEDGKIEASGNLLLNDNILIVFTSEQKINAYDVSDKANPKEKWTAKLGDREYLIGARLMNGKIYITTRHGVDHNRPCPIVPLTMGEKEVSIACTDIYYPSNGGAADATYNFMVLDGKTGEVEKKSAFVGSSGQTVFYMSENAIYLTYQTQVDMVEVAYLFFSNNSDLVPSWVIERLAKVRGYDLSLSAKSAELYATLEKMRNSLNNDDALKLENEMTNRMEDFYEKYRREIGKTGIVKMSLSDFSAKSTEVPGTPLNQFSLDEHKEHLRIAVTIGESWWGLGGFGVRGKTVSDVYIIDNDMDIVGSVKDMGETERIYSVRFLGERGYVVTFRQTDPFYVLDLSSPKKPALRGELKIPGFSSYLHPLEGHKVLGIGREDGKVKLSIFDATFAENPKEVAKYQLNEYWSEALDNHHAFLLDKKHEVFFIPGSQGGYIFSYKGDQLKLEKAVSGVSVQRAIYLEDYMYLIGKNEITVLDEKTWDKVKEFTLN